MAPVEMDAPWFHFVFGTVVLCGPLAMSDFIAIGLKKGWAQKKFSLFVVFPAIIFLPAAIAFVLAPYWFKTVNAHVVQSAELSARGRPYCIVISERPAEKPTDLTVQRLLVSGGFWSIDPRWFYALQVIEMVSGPDVKNWSFHTGQFEPVSKYFQTAGLEKSCRPASDPLGLSR